MPLRGESIKAIEECSHEGVPVVLLGQRVLQGCEGTIPGFCFTRDLGTRPPLQKLRLFRPQLKARPLGRLDVYEAIRVSHAPPEDPERAL